MTQLRQPLRLDRLQQAIIEVFDDALGSDVSVGWAYGEAIWDANYPTGQVVNLTMLGGPTYGIRNGVHGVPFVPPSSITVTVDTAVVATRYIVTINEYSYFHDAIGGDTVDTIRDALVALIVADADSPYVAAAAVPAGELTVVPSIDGDIWQMKVSSGITAVPTLSNQVVLKTTATRLFTIDIGCFSKGRSPRTGAWALASLCEAALASPEHAQIFSAYDVGVWGKGPAVDLSAVENGHWESRVSFDVTLAMKSTFTTPISTIETVNVAIGGSTPSATQVFTVVKP